MNFSSFTFSGAGTSLTYKAITPWMGWYEEPVGFLLSCYITPKSAHRVMTYLPGASGCEKGQHQRNKPGEHLDQWRHITGEETEAQIGEGAWLRSYTWYQQLPTQAASLLAQSPVPHGVSVTGGERRSPRQCWSDRWTTPQCRTLLTHCPENELFFFPLLNTSVFPMNKNILA